MQVPPTFFWVSCLILGCQMGLLALAFLIVQRGASIFNFAIGGYAMVAGLAAAYLAANHGWNKHLAIGFGLLLAVLLSVLTDVLVVRPLHAANPGQELPILVAVTAVLFAIEQAAGTSFGRVSIPGVPWVDGGTITIGSTPVQTPALFMIGATVLTFVAVQVWSSTATMGRLVQAVGNNARAAEIIGFPVAKIRLVAFGVGGLIAGLAVSLVAFRGGVYYSEGLDFAVVGFLTLVISGRGSTWSPLVGGVIFATVQQLAVFYFGGASLDYATLILALAFFALRPEGIFVQRKARA